MSKVSTGTPCSLSSKAMNRMCTAIPPHIRIKYTLNSSSRARTDQDLNMGCLVSYPPSYSVMRLLSIIGLMVVEIEMLEREHQSHFGARQYQWGIGACR